MNSFVLGRGFARGSRARQSLARALGTASLKFLARNFSSGVRILIAGSSTYLLVKLLPNHCLI
jgi:hypothetical protein